MAALTAARLASYLQERLQVTRVTLCSSAQKHQVAEAIHRHLHPRSEEADIYFQLEVLPYN